MGDPQPRLKSLVAEDCFLRRVTRPKHVKDGVVMAEAFKDRYPTLSFTFQDDDLKTDAGLEAYREEKANDLESRDLPGICVLTHEDLTVRLEPPLPPRPDRDQTDEKYGHLHCCTDRPRDLQHREKMAKLAGKHPEWLRELVRFKRRRLRESQQQKSDES